MTNSLTVVMLVGGRGSRLAPYTDDKPKCLIDVAGKPLLDRILDNLTPLFDGKHVNYVFLVNYLGRQVEEHVTNNLSLDATFLYDKPGADQVSVVLEAKPYVTGAMLLYYGDTIIFPEMKSLPDYSFMFTNEVEDVSGYGYVTDNGIVIEKPRSNEIGRSGLVLVGGIYIIDPVPYFKYLKGSKYRHFISETLAGISKRRINHHISIDTPEDWVMANKYYEGEKK